MSQTTVLERAAQAFERAAARAPEGMRELLADDVAFLRRVDARVHRHPPRPAPPAATLAPREEHGHEGRNTAVAVGVALAAGVALAKAVDWLALTEPRVR